MAMVAIIAKSQPGGAIAIVAIDALIAKLGIVDKAVVYAVFGIFYEFAIETLFIGFAGNVIVATFIIATV